MSVLMAVSFIVFDVLILFAVVLLGDIQTAIITIVLVAILNVLIAILSQLKEININLERRSQSE